MSRPRKKGSLLVVETRKVCRTYFELMEYLKELGLSYPRVHSIREGVRSRTAFGGKYHAYWAGKIGDPPNPPPKFKGENGKR